MESYVRAHVHGRCWSSLVVAWAFVVVVAGQDEQVDDGEEVCAHCATGPGFQEILKPEVQLKPGQASSNVHVIWATHVEVIPLTSDIGGWEPPSFHKNLAKEAVKGWRAFGKRIAPNLPEKHQAKEKLADSFNHGFFQWQKKLYESGGDVAKSLEEDPEPQVLSPEMNSTWPEMNALPEYQKLRRIVEKMSRRYLVRSGVEPDAAKALNYSIFNWAAVHGQGEFHEPHAHAGEWHVGVFYAQVGPSGGKLRISDPRGHSAPYGRSFTHSPKAGELILFPSWLNHMATVSHPSSSMADGDKEPLRVIFSFNIGPASGPMPSKDWWSDPTGDIRFSRRSTIDPKELNL